MRISDWSSDVCSSDLPRANPDFTAQTPETRTFTDADGKVWTLHQSATFADSTIRFTGEVYTWPVEWDLSGADRWVKIKAAGITRRLQPGRKPLKPSLRPESRREGKEGVSTCRSRWCT